MVQPFSSVSQINDVTVKILTFAYTDEIEDGFQDRSSPASILLPPPVFSSFTSAGSDIQLSFSAFADANLFPFSPAERFNIGSPVIGATIPPNQNINGNVTINIPLFNTVSERLLDY